MWWRETEGYAWRSDLQAWRMCMELKQEKSKSQSFPGKQEYVQGHLEGKTLTRRRNFLS